jgi:hypothetical protein
VHNEQNLAEREHVSLRAIVSAIALRGADFRRHIWWRTACGFQGIEVIIAIEDLLATKVADFERDIATKENVL